MHYLKHIHMFQLPRKRNCKCQHYLILVDIHVNDNDKALPKIHCLPKIHKAPICWRFFIASKTHSTKALSKVISKVFKLDHHFMENFPNKSWFYSITKNSWVLQNSFPVINTLDNINTRKTQKIFQPLTLTHFIQQFLITFWLKVFSDILNSYLSCILVEFSSNCTLVGFSSTSLSTRRSCENS